MGNSLESVPTAAASAAPVFGALAALNPNASSDYLKSAQYRDDIAQARNFVFQAEGAESEVKRQAMLAQNGVSDADYVRLKQLTGFPLSAKEAEAQREQIEGKAPELEATPGPFESTIMAGAGAPLIPEVGIPAALAGTAAANEYIREAQAKIKSVMPNHPILGELAGALAGAGSLGVGAGALSAAEGAEGAEGRINSAATAAPAATGDTGEAAAVSAEPSSTQEPAQDVSPVTGGTAKDTQPLSVEEVAQHPAVQEARARLEGQPTTLQESTPEQLKARAQEIYAALAKTPPVPEGEAPTLRIVMGPVAAGKSTAIAAMPDAENFTRVQPDAFQPLLAQATGQQYDPADASLYYSEAGRIGSQSVERLIGERRNVLYETVATSPDRLRQLGKLAQKQGYNVELIQVPSTPEESATGALDRYLDGGRFVDPEDAAASASKSSAVFDTLKGESFVTKAEQLDERPQKLYPPRGGRNGGEGSGSPGSETPESVPSSGGSGPEGSSAQGPGVGEGVRTPQRASFLEDRPGGINSAILPEHNIAGTKAAEATPLAREQAAAAASEHHDAEMIAAARANPMTSSEVAAIQLDNQGAAGHALLASPAGPMDMLRLGQYSDDRVQELFDAARYARETGDAEATTQAQALSKELAEVVAPRFAAAAHQSGLAQRTFGVLRDKAVRDQTTDVLQALADSGGDFDRFSRALATMSDVPAREELMRQASGVNWTAKGALYNLYLNSILSLNSVGKKVVSDVANIIFQIPASGLAEAGSRAAETAAGADYGSMGVSPGETLARARALAGGIGEALRYGLDAAKTNLPTFEKSVGFFDNRPIGNSLMEGSGWEDTWIGRGLDYFGHLVSAPGRGIVGVDQFSKAVQYRMELAALAHRQGMQEAAQEGLQGAELAARASDIANQYVAKPVQWMIESALDAAKTNTFTADLEGSLAKADAWRQSNYLTRTLFPFFKTPANITLQGIRQSPLAPLSPTLRAVVSKGGADGALAMSKAALGSALLVYLAHHVAQGHITGGVPENLDADTRNLWLRDNQPYSINLGDDKNRKWMSYQGLEPLAWLLGATADITPAFAYLNAGEAQQAVGTLVSGMLRELDRQPMWGAAHMIMQGLDDAEKGKSEGIANFLGRQAGGMIPGTIANYAGETDPVKRQTLGALDELRNRIPYLKQNGIPTLDPFGKPVIVPPGFAWNEFPAFKVSSAGADPVADKLIELHNLTGFKPPEIPRSLGPGGSGGGPDDGMTAPERLYGAALSPAQRNRWMELRGNPQGGINSADTKINSVPTLYDATAKMIAGPEFQKASDVEQANQIHQLFIAYQKMGEARLRFEDPSIDGAIAAAYQRKSSAMAPKGGINSASTMGTP